MNDLLDRAIAHQWYSYDEPLVNELIAEIMQLTNTLEARDFDIEAKNIRIDNADAEIERLRVEAGRWQRACTGYTEALAGCDAEIKRLNKTLDDHLDSEAAETRRADRERDRARKAEVEIERLRALIRQTYEESCGRDYQHLPLPAAVAMARQADAEENERLRQQVTQRGARMQTMREWMQSGYELMGPNAWPVWDAFLDDKPEAAEWFDDEGVPR